MQSKSLFQVLLAPVAVTVVSAACTARPCGRDAINNILRNSELAEPASSFCSVYNQPITTESLTATKTTTETVTVTAAGETVTVTSPVTEVETVTDIVTELTTSYSTVYPALPTIYKRDIDFGPLTDLTRFPTSRISSACSCLVATPSPALTFTRTETTTETATTAVTIPADEIAVITFPVTTVITTTETQTTTLTTVVPTTTTPAVTVPDVCANRPMNLCCQAVTPWVNNRAFFEALCGYTPPLASELVGDRCVGLIGESCPDGTIQTCCAQMFINTSQNACLLGRKCAVQQL